MNIEAKLGMRFIAVIAIVNILSACEYFNIEPEEPRRTSQDLALSVATPSTASDQITRVERESNPTQSPNLAGRSPKRAEIYRAKDSFGSQAEPQSPLATDAASGDVSFNFVETPIAEAISVVLGDTLKVDYVIDPKVQGTITIRTSKPVSVEAVWDIFEDALTLAGAAIVEEANFVKIVPLAEAGAAASGNFKSVNRSRRDRGFGLHVIPLLHANAVNFSNVMKEFVVPGRQLKVDRRRNFLLYSGTSQEAVDLLDMVEFFDVDWMAGTSYGIYPVQVAEAQKIVDELTIIFRIDKDGKGGAPLRLVPIERMNAILAITTSPEYLDRMRIWVKRLDRGEDNAAQRIYVYRVQYGRAIDLSDVLNQLSTGPSERRVLTEELPPGSVAVERQVAARTQPQEGDATAVKAAAPIPKNSVRLTKPVSANTTDGVAVVVENEAPAIIADEANNALVIRATPAQYRMLRDTLEILDAQPLQVLIEATIAEVTLNDDLKYGVEWFLTRGDVQGGFSLDPLGAVGLRFPGFSFLFGDDKRIAAISALAEVTDVKVVSSPQLMVLNNQTASLQVGDQVPIATQSSISSTDSDAPTVNTVSYRDTGIVLEVTPRVNASGHISVDIEQEVSDVVPTSSSTIDSPTIQQRKIKSSVALRTGQTIALGGLIRDNVTEGESGVPLLKDIPILGNLFKVTSEVTFRTELLILITMHIIRDPEDSRRLTEELRERFRSLRPLVRKAGQPNS